MLVQVTVNVGSATGFVHVRSVITFHGYNRVPVSALNGAGACKGDAGELSNSSRVDIGLHMGRKCAWGTLLLGISPASSRGSTNSRQLYMEAAL